MKKIYFEAKAMELITLFFQWNENLLQSKEHLVLPEDIERLKQAKEIVLTHLDQPYSINDLAKSVGLNEYKLKLGFKQLFGTTVFDLIRSQRMKKAAWLMEVEGFNVSETAATLGYSNFSNFTVAFRKHFGINPSEYLKNFKTTNHNIIR